MVDDVAIENALRESQRTRQMIAGADQEHDKSSRWLKVRIEILHRDKVTNPQMKIARDAASTLASQLALETEEGAGSDLTTR